MITLLGEAIRTKTLREWLAWSDSANRFENREALNLVYYLITKNAEGEEDEDAISNVQAMRNLRFVVDDAGALACLIRTRSLAAAQAVLRGRVSDQSASSTSLASLARAIAS
jgi:citrate lyase gamma subunit